MNYKKKKYGLLIIVTLLLISVGYALINTTLKLNGSSKIKKARWDIYFDKVEHESGVTSTETKIDDKKTTVSFDIDLEKPGDYYQFNVDTVNDGTIDAIIDSTELTGLTNTTKEIIDYDVTYSDGSSVNKCDTLNSGDRKTLLVKVKYFDDVKEEELLENNENLKLKFKINYVQNGTCDRNPVLEIDPNGGKYNNSRKVTKRNVEKNSSLTIPEAEREGYDFVNWKTSAGVDLEKDSETHLTTINVGTSDIKVIAQWEKKIDPSLIKHTITIDPNGGLYNGSEEVITYQKKKNETVEVNGTIEREGYIFKGWNVVPAESSFVGNVLTVGLTDVTLTATWELDEENVVAKIGNKYYTTLQKAFNAAVTGDKIELLKDITEVSTNTKEVSLDLGNHTINGTINNSGILTVDNGKIQTLTEGQAPIVNTGTIIIGTNDERVVQDSIILYGKTTGLLQNGKFYFYDGYIEGDIAFRGGYNKCAPGHIVYIDYDNILNCQKAYLTKTSATSKVKVRNPGAQEGDDPFIFYKSLGLGIANAKKNNDPDVYLLQSFQDSEDIIINDGDVININLEGYTLEEGAHITNNGTLTIKDTEENHGTFNLGTYAITNHGTFNLSNVNIVQTMNSVNTIDNYGDLNFSNSTIQSKNGYALNNKTTGTLTFTNDTYFTSTGGYSFYNDATEEVILTGGNFQGIHNKGTNLIVDGATVTNPTNNDAIYNENSNSIITLRNVSVSTTNKYALNNKGTANVESGTYDSTSSYTLYNYSSSTLNITGGTITGSGQTTVYGCGTVNISGNPTISNSYNSNSGEAVYIKGTATIEGGTITALNDYAIYKYYGLLNITGGNISNSATSTPAIYNKEGNITISGGNIVSNNSVGLTTSYNTTNITGGYIKGKTYGVLINYSNATLNIGTDDDNIDPNLPDRTPVIVGDTYGVYRSSGTVKFYDGIIKGKNDSVYYGEVNEVADGTEIVKGTETIEGELYYTAYLYVQDDFLEITNVGTYNSLKKAITKIKNDLNGTGKINVYKPGKISSPATIPSGNNITLNLNGIKITSSVVITNEGTFRIVDDSQDDGTGKKGEIENVVSDIIKNKKTLIIDEGIFTASNGKIINQNYGSSSDTNYYTTINGGKFNGNSSGYYDYLICVDVGKIDINGGVFTSPNSQSISLSSGTNTISNATIKSTNQTAININSYTTLTLDNVTITDTESGIANHGTLYLNNSNITTTKIGVYVSSNSYYYSPKIYVTNSNIISGAEGIQISDGSSLVFNSGTITSDTDAIYNYESNATIIDGTIYGKNRGIYMNSYYPNYSINLTLGNNEDATVADTTKPVIIGDNYGIYTGKGQNSINFYDGIVKSKGTQISGTITTMPVGYITTNGVDSIDSSYKTTYLTTQLPFIHAGGDDYTSLQLAINAAANSDGKMTLIRDGLNTSDATIESTQNLTLDLNGFTMTNTKTITNNGTLTINDDSGNGNIINSSFTQMFSNSNTLIINNGNYNVDKNILIKQTSDNSNFTLNGGNLLGVNDKIIDNKGQFTMNGGTINWTGDSNSNPILSDYGDITITGGTIGNDTLRVNTVIRMSYNIHTLEISGDAKIMAGQGNTISMYGDGSKKPNLIIRGGTITSKNSNAIDLYKSNADIYGGTIKSDSGEGLYIRENSTINITGGEIIGKTYGLYQSSSTVTLGNNDGEIKSTPILKGDTYGVYINSGTFNFYDGILKGKNNNVFSGNITTTADNCNIGSGTEIDPDTGETYYTKYLIPKEPFVWNKTKGTSDEYKYTDLQLAITEASNNDELELIANGTVYAPITIPNKTLKLDLNNFNISISQPITNNGTLTIIDENTSGTKGKISTAGAFDLIQNNSNLTIDNVSIENLYENYYIINNASSATLTLNNADITGKYGIKNNTNSTLTSTNSNITSTFYETIYNLGGTIDITGGEIKNTSNDSYSRNVLYLYSDSTNPGDVTIRNTSILKNQSYYDCINVYRYDSLKLYNVTAKGKVAINSNSEIKYDGGTLTGNISSSGGMIINNLTLNSYQNYGISNTADLSKNNKITNSNITINTANTENDDGIRNSGNIRIKNTNITLNNTSNNAAVRNYSGGQFELIGGNINVSRNDQSSSSKLYGIYNNTTSSINNIIRPKNITVTGGEYAYGIYNTSGILTILSGNVDVSNAVSAYGIYQTGGEVIMGTYDGSRLPSADVSTTTPYIKAVGTTGIGETKIDGEFRFFDGRIEGSTNAIKSAPSSSEENYIIQTYRSVTTGYEYAILECLTQQSTSTFDWSIKVTDNDIVKERLFSIDNLAWKDTNNDPVGQLQYGATSNIKIELSSLSMTHKYRYTITTKLADGSPVEVTNNSITGIMDIPNEDTKSFNIVLNCASPTADYTAIDKDVLVTITLEEVEE